LSKVAIQKFDCKRLSIAVLASLMIVGSLRASEFETVETDVKADNQQNQLFESRFKLDDSNKIDLSVFDVCPSRSAQSSSDNQLSNTEFYSATNNQDSESNDVVLSADRVPENSESRTRLEGHVIMASSASLLKADELVTDNIKQTITAKGNVSVESKDSLLQANQFSGNQASGTSELKDVKFHFFVNNANGEAETIAFDEKSVATLNDLTFSTCPTNDDSWRFSANELQLDQGSGWGEAWGMWLKVQGIPVFYFPYLNFPIDAQRKSGMLTPAVSNSSRNGLDISIPVYWNIAALADATFWPRRIENRGDQLGTEFRYLTENSMNELSFEVLAGDSLATDLLSLEPTLGDGLYGLSEDRWAISISNKTHFDENWSASLDASKVSDRDYFRDLGAGLISPNNTNSQSQLISQGNFSYQDDIWFVSLLAESTQSLAGDEPYRILPSLISNADYYHPASGFHWQFESDLTNFAHSDKSLTEGTRINLRPSVSYPMLSSYSWLMPKISYQVTSYRQDNLQTSETLQIDRNLPTFSLDTGLLFDREIQWDKEAVTHSLEPRLFYAYIPFREQSEINNFDSRLPDFSFSQLWQANRFAGVDRIGDTNHVALALTNRFVEDYSGEEMLSFSLGRKFYFDDRQVQFSSSNITQTGRYSPWLFEATYNASESLEFSSFIEWSDQKNAVLMQRGTNLARSRLKFEPIKDHIVNLSHRVRNKNGLSNEELDLSFAWPINDEWRLVGRWYNDLELDRTAETLFGFEYESCCWAISIVSRRYLDVGLDAAGNPVSSNLAGLDEFNSGIQLQFVFKGLGSPGQKSVSQLLKNSIRGYQSRF